MLTVTTYFWYTLQTNKQYSQNHNKI